MARKPLPRPSKSFVAVPNEYFNGWLKEISSAECLILSFIIRKTLGYQKAEDWISLSQFEDNTGLSKKTIIKCLKSLESKEMVFRRMEGIPGREKVYWRLNIESIEDTSGEITQVGVEKIHPPSGEITPTIYNITKDIKNKEYVPNSNELELSDLLKSKILENNPKAIIKNNGWIKDIDLMIRIDKRTHQEIKERIIYGQQHHFWRKNILSMATLRKQFDRLTLDMEKWTEYKQEKTEAEKQKEIELEAQRKKEETEYQDKLKKAQEQAKKDIEKMPEHIKELIRV